MGVATNQIPPRYFGLGIIHNASNVSVAAAQR